VTFFNVIVPFYNAEKWLTRCLKTVKAQDYDNYRVVIIDDCSTDNSKSVIENEIEGFDKFECITTTKNRGALNSTFTAIEHIKPDDEDVVLVLDGDDWFAKKNVLSTLNDVYTNNDCLMTYGSYIEYPSGQRGKFSKQLPEFVIKNKAFREYEWVTSH